MGAARAAMKKLGGRRWAAPLPPEAEEDFSSQEDMEGLLDHFEEKGIIRVQFGSYGVYTITSMKAVSSRTGGYTGKMHGPVAVWWKGTTPDDRGSIILYNSLHSYHLPHDKHWGQALQLNLTANFFESYGKTSETRQAAAGFLNVILAGVAIHKTGCGVTTSDTAFRLNIPEKEREKIKVLRED